MNNDMETILRKRKLRDELLLELRKASIAKPNNWINFFEIADNIGLSKESAKEMFDYFRGKGFFVSTTDRASVRLSHRAIDEIDKSLTNPEQSNEQPLTTVNQNFFGPIGAVQTGNNNIANVNQNFNNANTLWIKEHHAEYAGKYIALENGKLVGEGRNFPETLADAKKNGAEKPFITYVFPPDSEPFGGW